jgi:hypothetical protein
VREAPDDFQRWLEEDSMRSDVSAHVDQAVDQGHVMIEHDDCPLSNCTTHWQCDTCGAMVVVMRGEVESSPSALAMCGYDATAKGDDRLAP